MLRYDPEYFKVFKPLIPFIANCPKLNVDDIIPNRKARDAGLVAFLERIPESPDEEQRVYHAKAPDGYQVPVIGLNKKDALLHSPGPVVLHFHGGGMILGSAQMYARPLLRQVSQTGISIFTVDYYLAPEFTGTTLAENCYTAPLWLCENAHEHGIDPARIAVYGESAGGGLAAGVTLLARDRNLQPPLAKQILVYPMLDDCNVIADKAVEPLAFWKSTDNAVAWTAVLKGLTGIEHDGEVSPYIAPARAVNLEALPPAYINVDGLDIFRDENVLYATRLLSKNVETELHVYPGVPHAFDLVAPNIWVTKRT